MMDTLYFVGSFVLGGFGFCCLFFVVFQKPCRKIHAVIKELNIEADTLCCEIDQLREDRESMLKLLEFLHKEQDRLIEYNAALELQGDKLVDAIDKACEEINGK